MKKEEVDCCVFSNWFDLFKKFTIKSRILPLPQDVLTYLREDGIVLPEGGMRAADPDSDDDVDWDEDTTEVQAPKFLDFEEDIKKAMESLGGEVFPKLNWSAPRDASWISATNSLKCSSPSDIFLLLKSSDFISHDLNYPYENCSNCDRDVTHDVIYELVLKKWYDLNPGAEFRCFVRDNTLIGICQRHHSSYFPHIKQEEDSIVSDIHQFFLDVVQSRFQLPNYVLDVYLKGEGRLYVIDFNPFGPETDGLLFTWQELLSDDLLSISTQEPCFRYIQSEHGVQPNEYQRYGMPADFTHLSTGQDPHKLIDLLKMKTQNQEEATSEDETENT